MKKRIRNLYNQIIIRFFSNSCHICEEERSYNIRFFHACGNEYMIEFVKNMGSEACHKWVGAQYYLDKVFTVVEARNAELLNAIKTSRSHDRLSFEQIKLDI